MTPEPPRCPRCGSTNVIVKLKICQAPGCHHWWN